MILYPAIDILGGRAVRLAQGDFDSETVYDDDPLAAARAWVDAGARYLHVVDLDGARGGRAASNLEHLRADRRRAAACPCSTAAGCATLEAVRDALRGGRRAGDPRHGGVHDSTSSTTSLGDATGERVVVSVDVRGGRVATAGWTERPSCRADGGVERLQRRGVRRFVYTNVDRDGMLEGPDLEEVGRIAGGGARPVHLLGRHRPARATCAALAQLRLVNLAGVIVGKALYEGRFTVARGAAERARRACD